MWAQFADLRLCAHMLQIDVCMYVRVYACTYECMYVLQGRTQDFSMGRFQK